MSRVATSLIILLCSGEIANADVTPSLCQPTDESCITLSQSRQITSDYATDSSGQYVDTAAISCRSVSFGNMHGYSCGVSISINETTYWFDCTIWSDGGVYCSVQ